jgi:hypothetical protein
MRGVWPRLFFSGVVACLLLSSVFAQGEALPWPLRDHFSFGLDGGMLDFDAESGAWRVRVKAPDAKANPSPKPGTPTDGSVTALEATDFAITLGDGRTLSVSDFGKGTATHDDFGHGPFGAGHFYEVSLPEAEGLLVRFRLETVGTLPFALIRMYVENRGDEAINIHELRPAVMGVSRGPHAPEMVLARRFVTLRGRQLLYDNQQAPGLALLHQEAWNVLVGVGVIPRGGAASGVQLESAGGIWQGAMTCSYAPGIALAPGETVEADTLCISYGLRSAPQLLRHFSWAWSEISGGSTARAEAPRAWVTVAEEEGLADLVRAAKGGANAGVRHALVPAYWEGRPGSLKGAAPRYPKSMRQAVADLQAAGSAPGISFDPLSANKGGTDWSVETSDGRCWLNPAAAKGKAAVEEKTRTLTDWGFKFLVPVDSDIPDSVLSHFGLSRAGANAAALKAIQEAVGNTVQVFAPCRSTLKATHEAWLPVVAAAGTMVRYGLQAGPARMAFDADAALDEDWQAAVRLWPGPIEFLGAPPAASKSALAEALSEDVLTAWPLDGGMVVPRRWQTAPRLPEGESASAAVLLFSGARAWDVHDVDGAEDGPWTLWRVKDHSLVSDAQATAQFEVYGLHRPGARPALLGLSGDHGLYLEQLSSLKWSAKRDSLVGDFKKSPPAGAVLYAYIPEPWRFQGAQIGGKRVRSKDSGPLLALKWTNGNSFTLEFK